MTLTNLKFFFVKLFATFFYTAFLPLAPASWGSLASLVVVWFVWNLSLPIVLLIYILSLIVAIWSAGEYEKISGAKDNRLIVVDEALGIFLVTFAIPHSYIQYIFAFFLFRIFDNWKPFPIRWFEKKITGGLGVVLDDLLAALYVMALMTGYNLTISQIG